MARHAMQDGTVVDTDRCSESYAEERDWDGHNRIGRSSGSQWHYQSLYRSRKGRYYIVYSSGVQGETEHAEWVSPERAAAWLALNEYEIPAELAAAAEAVTE